MATLERIRRRSGLLIVVIGLAMGAFILTDLLGSGGILFNDYNNMGSINGEKITRQDFITRITKLRKSNPQYAQFSEKTMADAVWSQLEREIIMNEEASKLGLGVTPTELNFTIKSSQEIVQAFTNPQTGQFDDFRFNSYVSQLRDAYLDGTDPQAIEGWLQWVEYEKNVKQQTLINKYNKAVEYGLYVPSELAREEYVKTNASVQGNFVYQAFSSIADSTVEYSESDLKSYYNSHKSDFEVDESRNFDYITFNIVPSEEDKAEVLAEMNNLLENRVEENKITGEVDSIIGFRNTEDDSSFVSIYSDAPFDDKYYKKGELAPEIDTVAFSNEAGHVEGPYLEGSQYVMYKINGSIEKPDSVKAKHILISYAGSRANNESVTRTGQEAQLLSDSLFKLIEADPTQFDTVSTQYNDDAVAKTKGGDLGWFEEGAMVPAFGKYCFRNEKGSIGLVLTEFGFHIIMIEDASGSNKAVRVATITREVRPSQATIEGIHRDAAMFASEAKKSDDYEALATEKGYLLRSATNILKGAENVAGLGQNRDIVKWTFAEERMEGDLNVFSTNDQHITVILTGIMNEGVQPFDKVKDNVEREVIKEKKAEMFISKINESNATDMASLATAVGVDVKPQATNMAGSAISGVGPEPKVVGVLLGLEPNVMSEPIVGNAGVFVVSVQEVSPVLDKQEYTPEQDQLLGQVRGLVVNQVFNSLKESADIKDLHNDIY